MIKCLSSDDFKPQVQTHTRTQLVVIGEVLKAQMSGKLHFHSCSPTDDTEAVCFYYILHKNMLSFIVLDSVMMKVRILLYCC